MGTSERRGKGQERRTGVGLGAHEGPGESIFDGALNLEPPKFLWLVSKREIYWLDWGGETQNLEKYAGTEGLHS